MDDAYQPWVANHLVEVTHSIIPATWRYHADMGECLLRWGHQSWNLVDVTTLQKTKPYPDSRATLVEPVDGPVNGPVDPSCIQTSYGRLSKYFKYFGLYFQ